jgi:hypothetical protein
MSSTDWRAQLPPGQQVEAGHVVNIKQICKEFAGSVVGLEGQVRRSAASKSVVSLSLRWHRQTCIMLAVAQMLRIC